MHREEDWTLARKASNQKALSRLNSNITDAAGTQQVESDGSKDSSVTPQRRRLVFTDPVAFRCVSDI